MNLNFNDLKKHCAEYLIFDTYQYIEGAYKNLRIAKFCADVVEKLIDLENKKHSDFKNGMSESISEQIVSKNSAEIDITQNDLESEKISIAGIEVSATWLLEKYIQDYFQYVRNIFDGLSQVIHSGIIANKSKNNNEQIDFSRVHEIMQKYKNDFPKTFNEVEYIFNSDIFKYISHVSNRIKHISPLKITMSHEIFGSKSTFEIKAFEKNGIMHLKKDINTIIKEISDFSNIQFLKLIDTVVEESKFKINADNRISKVNFYKQHNYIDEKSTFTIVFLQVTNSIDELKDEIQVLPVKCDGDNIIACNLWVDKILVCSGDGNSINECYGKFVAKSKLKNDGLYHYQTYEKDTSCNGVECYITVASSQQSEISEPAFYGNIITANFSEPSEEERINRLKMIDKFKEIPCMPDDSVIRLHVEKISTAKK